MKMVYWILLFLFVSLFGGIADGQTTKIQAVSQDLDSGSLSFTTTTYSSSATSTGCINIVSVHYSAAPEAVETISVYLDSPFGANHDVLLVKTNTVAATTTDVVFTFNNGQILNSNHQLRIVGTNASQSVGEVNDDPTMYVTTYGDTTAAACNGDGLRTFKDGVEVATVTITTAEITDNTIQEVDLKVVDSPVDEEYLTYETTTGDFEWQSAYDTVAEDGSNLTKRYITNFIGAPITCVDNGGAVRTDCTVVDKIVFSSFSSATQAATFFMSLQGDTSTTEDDTESIIDETIICTSIRARVDVAPGAGTSWAIALRDDGSDTALTCTVTDAATTCTGSGTVTISSGSITNIHVTASGAVAGTAGQSVAVTCKY